MNGPTAPLLDVRGLEVSFGAKRRRVTAVRGLDLSVDRGEVLAVVGESGSGKSVSMLALLGLLPKGADVEGRATFDGEELVGRPERALRQLRGRRIGMIFQDPMTSLNPVLTVGFQVGEALRIHGSHTRREAKARAVQLLGEVGIPQAAARADQYPHELSGGMRQRVVVAMAIANRPDLLIADEPTTALDVTIQAQVLDLIKEVQTNTGSAVILITHDLGVVARVADRVAVMYAGRLCELGTADDVYETPRHPYTVGLLGSMPDVDGASRAPLRPIPGHPPDLATLGPGCAFRDRCAFATDVCETTAPVLLDVGHGHLAACHHTGEIMAVRR